MSNFQSKISEDHLEKEPDRIPYSAPKLTRHGKIADLTLGGSTNLANCESDGFLGTRGSKKFPGASPPCP